MSEQAWKASSDEDEADLMAWVGSEGEASVWAHGPHGGGDYELTRAQLQRIMDGDQLVCSYSAEYCFVLKVKP